MTARQPVYATMLVFAACLLAACGSESTGGVYNQVFNVSGHWSGTIYGKCFSGGSDPVSMTLSDGGGDVTGTMTVGGHTSVSSSTLSGTAVQAPEKTTGDNPLTADQENSNRGTLNLSLDSPLMTGGVESVEVLLGGSGYTSAPTVHFRSTGSGGSGAAGYAVIGGDTEDAATAGAGGVASVTVDNAGSGYTSAPTVELLSTGHGGKGAKATAVIDAAGEVVGFVVTDPGSGYVTAPQVMLSGGGGSGATATATLFGPEEDAAGGTVTAVIVTDPGSGYVTAPTVTFSGGGGSGAAATATLDTAEDRKLITITVAGTSSKLSGHYIGLWNFHSTHIAACGANPSGAICLSRAGLCPPP